jgi:hypothetical protein
LSVLLLATLPGEASAQDRPDFPDISLGASPSHYVSASSYSNGQIGFAIVGAAGGLYDLASDQMVANGYVHWGVRRPSGTGLLDFRLFEPDRVIRKAKIQLMSQGRYVAFYFSVSTPLTQFGATLFPPTSVGGAGCRALFKAKDGDGDRNYEMTLWRASCNKEALDGLGLTEQQRDALKKIFGSRNVLKVSGKNVELP